ncbi:MAG TPA: cytochrome C oxidase subunit IV family protein [Thermomicrobiales bacterium]|nr:cytochrome C oxidase subunit IV family protein [Thermomicrobiales bacterium]
MQSISRGDDGYSHGPGTQPGTDHLVDEHEGHPGERTYVKVAVILAVVTALEVAVYYIDALSDVLVPILAVLSIGKFVAVVGYFMHLKFDDRRFTWVFLTGLLIAASIVAALAAMFVYNDYEAFP